MMMMMMMMMTMTMMTMNTTTTVIYLQLQALKKFESTRLQSYIHLHPVNPLHWLKKIPTAQGLYSIESLQ
jgi:hypothetical protein